MMSLFLADSSHSSATPDNVLLIAENGSINPGQLSATNSSILASNRLQLNGEADFSGDNLLASGNDLTFNRQTQTVGDESRLRVISGRNLRFNNQIEARGEFLAGEDLTVNQDSTFIGFLGAKDDITFNGRTNVFGEVDDSNNDAVFSINTITVNEGNDNSQVASLTVSLASPNPNPLTIDFATIDGTAIAGEDYQAQSGTLTFAPGETSKTIAIDLIGDEIEELDEAFSVVLSNASGGVVEDGEGTINILDDDFTIDELTLNLNLVNDTGIDSTDNISGDVSIAGRIENNQGNISLNASLNSTNNDSSFDISNLVEPNGSFIISVEQLQQLDPNFGDGTHVLQLTATDNETENIGSSEITFTLDSVLTPEVLNSPTTSINYIDLDYGESVAEQALDLANYELTVDNGNDSSPPVEIDSIQQFSDSRYRLHLTENFRIGDYNLNISAAIEDLAGNSSINGTLGWSIFNNEPVEISPNNGEERVNLTRETIVRFRQKINPSTVNDSSFYLIANGERLAGRIQISSTNEFATFFYDEPLPPSTEVRVVVDGNLILDQSGTAIDADGDGNLGGIATSEFTTLSLTRIEGTDVFGYVYDSFNTNADGTDIPVVGATIRLDALPDVFAVTDETGFFHLENVPAPEFAVHIDGSTAINTSGDSTYATVSKILESRPGQEIQLTLDGENFDIYLPTIATEDIQQLSATEPTNIGFGTAGKEQLQELFPEIDSELWDLVQVTFPEGSAQDDAGNVATQATIIPVNPDRLPAPLPPNLDPQLIISIQADGATNFDVPAPIQFPNLEGLAPGERSLIWSFDHDAGDWAVVGTGTVSADGRTIVSDPGVGILAPGWHFVQSGTNANPETPCTSDDCIQISGRRGDIIRVDLNQALPQGAIASNWQIGNFEEGGRILRERDGSIVSEEGQTFEDSGIFYFIPTIDTSPTVSLQGSTPTLIDAQGPDRASVSFSADIRDTTNLDRRGSPRGILEINIEDGYSPITLNSAVGGEANNRVETAQVQQRLRFFNYPDAGEAGPPRATGTNPASLYPPGTLVATDGGIGPSTREAISLFQAAITNSGNPENSDGRVDPEGFTLQWLNASNAPRWVELIDPVLGGDFDIGRCTVSLCNGRQGTGQWERFGTHWVIQDILATTNQVNGTQLITGISEYGFTDLHTTHKGGHDIDVAYGGLGGSDAIARFGAVNVSLDTSSPTGDLRQFYLEQLETAISQEADANERAGLELVLQTVNEILTFYDVVGVDRWNSVIVGNRDSAGGYRLVRDVLNAIDPNLNPRAVNGHNDHYHIGTRPQARSSNFVQNANSLQAQENDQISTADGFGSSDRLYYRFQLENGFDVVGQSEEIGNFSEVLPPNTDYTLTVYQPSTNTSSIYNGTSNESGNITDLGVLFRPTFGGLDTDGDQIPDIGELALGTSAENVDTDNDGINDAAELEQGLDPLDGQTFPTGIVANLSLRGEAKAVIVEGSNLDSRSQTAYVATGSYGLAIVDASQFSNPIIQGQIDLPGDATDVGVDSNLNIAAVATNAGGLQLVDVSDPILPILRQTIDLDVTKVEVFEGVAYATVGTSIRAIDLFTGIELQNLELPGSGQVTGLAREGNFLYAFVSGSNTFSTIDISNIELAEVLGQANNINVSNLDVGVFVANGLAYLAGAGIRTIDVSNPNNPTLIANPDFVFTARNIALNGSGLALVSAEGRGVEVYDISDPQNTTNFLTQIDSPGFAYDVAIASGLSFVADGESGLQVINYLPFDNQGQAPSVSINTDAIDVDPNLEGIQVIEGSNIPLTSEINDDQQVRNLEILVNGEVVSNDVSFPFTSNIAAPLITAESDRVEVQVRATDTGGNATLSEVLDLQLVPDTAPPEINSIQPSFDSVLIEGLRTIEILFSESLAVDTINSDTIRLLDSQANIIIPENIQTRSNDRFIQLTFPALVDGDYELIIDASEVTDRVGNALGAENLIHPFNLEAIEINISTEDFAPKIEGIQIPENLTTIPINIGISNLGDTQIERLEFFVNGELIESDETAPFQISSLDLSLLELDSDSITVEANIIDSNSTVFSSEPQVFNFVPDTFGPRISFANPSGRVPFGIRSIQIAFNEPLSTNSLIIDNFQLRSLVSGNFLDPLNLEVSDDGRLLTLNYSFIGFGNHEIIINAPAITDELGNVMGTEAVTESFSIFFGD